MFIYYTVLKYEFMFDLRILIQGSRVMSHELYDNANPRMGTGIWKNKSTAKSIRS